MIFVHGALDIHSSLLHMIVWSLPTLLQPYRDAGNFNKPHEKLKFNAGTKICFHRAWCRVHCNWVESHFGEAGLENLSVVVMRAYDSDIFNTYSKKMEHRLRFLGARKDLLRWTEGQFRFRLPDKRGLQGKCCQKVGFSSVRPNVDIRLRKDGPIAEIKFGRLSRIWEPCSLCQLQVRPDFYEQFNILTVFPPPQTNMGARGEQS